MSNIWNQSGNIFVPGTDGNQSPDLPPAVYSYCINAQGTWWLQATAPKFEFPYKIYGLQDHIVERVDTAWEALDSSIGILLNGLKGTGKSVAAKLIANWAIGKGYPVLNCRGAIPLTTIFNHVEQPLIVLFDEFEKTHDLKEQQALLSVLDGMSRQDHKRLFIFTSNNKNIDPNLIDRPSRIRYGWEFKNLTLEVINEIIDDLLGEDVQKFRSKILMYLQTRKVLSIDVVKTVIAEVNIFKEDPRKFEGILNLTDKEVLSFKVSQLHDDGTETEIENWFKPSKYDISKLQELTFSGHEETWEEDYNCYGEGLAITGKSLNKMVLHLVEPTDDPKVWLCKLAMPRVNGWMKPYPLSSTLLGIDKNAWVEEKPKGWKVPKKLIKFEASGGKKQIKFMNSWFGHYNNPNQEQALLKIRIEPNLLPDFDHAKPPSPEQLLESVPKLSVEG